MKTSYLYLVSGLLSAAMLVGCGGSGGGGGATASVAPTAEITDANKTDLAVAATEAAKSATTTDAPTNLGFKSTVANVANKANMLPNQELVPGICTTGSVDATGLDSYTTTSFSIDMTFNNCVIDDYYETATYNGSASVTSNSNGINITYNNFSVTVGGETTSINGTLSCDSSYLNCTENLTYGGDISGTYSSTTYTTSNMEVSGDASGYNVNGSVTHPDHGTVTISATGVTFDCPGGYPGAGEITVTASGGVTATITFNDCDSFTIDYDGSTTTVFWNTL
jgi:hypothetical protein